MALSLIQCMVRFVSYNEPDVNFVIAGNELGRETPFGGVQAVWTGCAGVKRGSYASAQLPPPDYSVGRARRGRY